MPRLLRRFPFKETQKKEVFRQLISFFATTPQLHKKLTLTVVVIGQTGYGKSSLLRALTGYDYKVDHIKSCTHEAEYTRFDLCKHPKHDISISFIDLPGLGESLEQDQRYLKFYRNIIPQASLILFTLRADKRDHTVDYKIYNEFIRNQAIKTLFVITAVDKIEPLGRQRRQMLTLAQQHSLKNKIHSIAKLFQISAKTIRCTSIEYNQGVIGLMNKISEEVLSALASNH